MQRTWAMCLGGGAEVWEDVLALEAEYGQPWDGLVIAANDVGAHWPRPLHHWVTLHAEKLNRWEQLRRQQQLPPCNYTTWGKPPIYGLPTTDRVLEPWVNGTSGSFAVQVAHALGCAKVVLCGIPVTATPHFDETKERFGEQWLQAESHWRMWQRREGQLRGWVRSMSGRTRELLGAPTWSWLMVEESHA